MKKEYILAILSFSGLWGISEAVLGDVLYRADVPYASVPLIVVSFIILTFVRVYFPQTGTAVLIGALAMLYKFLNTPFFACHLLGIFLTGACYELFFSILKLKNRSLSAVAASYLSYVLFAVMIAYVFRYDYWVQAGFAKVVRHVGIGGSIAALASAILVPLSHRLSEKFKANYARPFVIRLQFLPGSVSVITVGLWIFGVTVHILSY